MASTSLCDYQILRDSPFTLDAATNDHERSFDFALPSDMRLSDGSRAPILSFAARVHARTRVQFFLNTREIVEFDLGKSKTRSLLEPFRSTDAFFGDVASPLQLRVLANTGRVTLQNLIIFYQVDVGG